MAMYTAVEYGYPAALVWLLWSSRVRKLAMIIGYSLPLGSRPLLPKKLPLWPRFDQLPFCPFCAPDTPQSLLFRLGS
jgi:hypothetical protein